MNRQGAPTIQLIRQPTIQKRFARFTKILQGKDLANKESLAAAYKRRATIDDLIDLVNTIDQSPTEPLFGYPLYLLACVPLWAWPKLGYLLLKVE